MMGINGFMALEKKKKDMDFILIKKILIGRFVTDILCGP